MENIKILRELKFANIAPEIWKKLGEIPRTGWVNSGVENPETVQDHTVLLRNLAVDISDLLIEFSEEDKNRLVDMLEVHDWPEAIIGDEIILTSDPEEKKRLKDDKFRREKDAMVRITESLGDEGKNILDLWLQFETSQDAISTFARQLDKYQAVEKAAELEKSQGLPLFREFRDSAIKDIIHPVLVQKISDMVTATNPTGSATEVK
jgi:putative hydrolase of HD superfamily